MSDRVSKTIVRDQKCPATTASYFKINDQTKSCQSRPGRHVLFLLTYLLNLTGAYLSAVGGSCNSNVIVILDSSAFFKTPGCPMSKVWALNR